MVCGADVCSGFCGLARHALVFVPNDGGAAAIFHEEDASHDVYEGGDDDDDDDDDGDADLGDSFSGYGQVSDGAHDAIEDDRVEMMIIGMMTMMMTMMVMVMVMVVVKMTMLLLMMMMTMMLDGDCDGHDDAAEDGDDHHTRSAADDNGLQHKLRADRG